MFAKLITLLIGVGAAVTSASSQECIPSIEPVQVPILLYHHVAPSDGSDRFTVSPDDFEDQMQMLFELGYETITPSQLVASIQCSNPIPEKSVLITFDDGHADVYQYAFPIMEQHGFFGAMYVVANRTQAPGFLSVDQLREMIESGWEIGSHTITHPDLAELSTQDLHEELKNSRLTLEDLLEVEIVSLAYPFGSFSPQVAREAVKAGYTNAMGLGILNTHGMETRYYLSRREVAGQVDLTMFMALLHHVSDQEVASDQGATASPSQVYLTSLSPKEASLHHPWRTY
jgi:peptidoglycan/xylan/chitin deacetylase (PgdA/CDA1 family)